MIYLERENQLTFSAQTRMKTDGNMFSLETSSSNDVDARYYVTSWERTTEESKPNKEKTLYATSKIGAILVKNRKKEEIEVCLEVNVRGEVRMDEFKNDAGKVIEKPGSDVLNPENLITWGIKVPANSSKELGFGYVVKHWENQQGHHFGGKPATQDAFGGFGGLGQPKSIGK